MKFDLLILCVGLAGCAPVATSEDTDTDTDSDGDTDSAATMPVTTASTMTTASTSASTSAGTMPTTDPPTTMDGTGTTDPPGTSEESGDCPPGTADCPCDIGSTCDGDLICIDGVCVDGIPCEEPDEEPNDTIAEAIELGEIACSADFTPTDGALAGLDMDVYGFLEGDGVVLPCFGPDPIVQVDAEEDVRVCVYLDCGEEVGTVDCDAFGSEPLEEDTFEELPGCCADNETRLHGYDCPGFGGEAPNFYARVISGDEEACLPYTLNLRFD